jgi:hypothetical protein
MCRPACTATACCATLQVMSHGCLMLLYTHMGRCSPPAAVMQRSAVVVPWLVPLPCCSVTACATSRHFDVSRPALDTFLCKCCSCQALCREHRPAHLLADNALQVKLWELSSRSMLQTLTEHTDQVWSCAFNADGTRLATVGDDKQLVVYSVA